MPFIAPHTPLDAPDDLKAKYADMEDDRKPARSRQTDSDPGAWIRLMLARQRAPHVRGRGRRHGSGRGHACSTPSTQRASPTNTIVLFFSDNGGAAYATGGADNVPLRGGKGDTFEGGIRVVSVMRWPAVLEAGTLNTSIMSAMDVFPTLAAAAEVEIESPFTLNGRNLWPALRDGKTEPREDWLFFASETPIRGHFNITAFNDDWKLVQEIDQGLLGADVTTHLFRIQDDPNEYNNLASQHPDVVAEITQAIHDWRILYPVSGTRHELVPPPGWRAPKGLGRATRCPSKTCRTCPHPECRRTSRSRPSTSSTAKRAA